MSRLTVFKFMLPSSFEVSYNLNFCFWCTLLCVIILYELQFSWRKLVCKLATPWVSAFYIVWFYDDLLETFIINCCKQHHFKGSIVNCVPNVLHLPLAIYILDLRFSIKRIQIVVWFLELYFLRFGDHLKARLPSRSITTSMSLRRCFIELTFSSCFYVLKILVNGRLRHS